VSTGRLPFGSGIHHATRIWFYAACSPVLTTRTRRKFIKLPFFAPQSTFPSRTTGHLLRVCGPKREAVISRFGRFVPFSARATHTIFPSLPRPTQPGPALPHARPVCLVFGTMTTRVSSCRGIASPSGDSIFHYFFRPSPEKAARRHRLILR